MHDTAFKDMCERMQDVYAAVFVYSVNDPSSD